jgi:pantoate--beta-alanine ligase
MFGEKDYQQLKVVTRMAQDLDLPTAIIGVATVREPDGLALSSRNAYLSTSERATAPTLHRVLTDCARRIIAGDQVSGVLDAGAAAIEQASFTLDYLEARHAETLAPVQSLADGPIRLLVAARIGKTRLIDNIPIDPRATGAFSGKVETGFVRKRDQREKRDFIQLPQKLNEV